MWGPPDFRRDQTTTIGFQSMINKRNNNRKRIPNSIRKRKQKSNQKLIIMRQIGRFAPDRLRANLVYHDTTLTRTVTSSDAINWSYRSSAYDPDPAALTGSIPGFVELANLYSSYCVKSMKLDFETANQNSEAVILVAWPSNIAANTNSLTKADLMEFSSNLRAQSKVLGASNGINVARLTVNALAESLVGPKFNTDLDYSASTSSNPVEMYHINIGFANPYGNFTYPMLTRSKVIYEVEFFRLRQLES